MDNKLFDVVFKFITLHLINQCFKFSLGKLIKGWIID